jgi:coenzyme F420-reducing hydrogenase delta subunit/NAD-dependent dihydropyrimidine dehydrogenase PreA subunit
MCSGRVDLAFILRAFARGADGVFIGGCRLNECNYVTHGNYHALNLTLLGKQIMQHIGLDPRRLRIEFMSGGEGLLFTDVVDAFVEEVKALGPLGEGEAENATVEEFTSRLAVVDRLVPYIKIAKRDKLIARRAGAADDDAYFTAEEIDDLLGNVVSYYIEPDKCQACMICLRRCPVNAIDGAKNRIHVIDQEVCIKCGNCHAACPPRFGAVSTVAGEAPPAPIPDSARTLVRKSRA